MSKLKLTIRTNFKNQRGFSIVELLITTFVFSIITVVISSGFVDVLDLQRRSFDAQVIQEETIFAFEAMAKEIRVSQIQSPDDLNCNAVSLSINHPINGPITYSVNSGIISKTVGGSTFPVTSAKVSFSRLNFCIKGSGVNDQQPRVTIIATVVATNGESGLEFNIQTTISSRDLREELLN